MTRIAATLKLATALAAMLMLAAGTASAGGGPALAGGTFDLSTILAGGALHPWHGTGVTAPAGHDGYFVISATEDYIKFHVLATVDIQID